MYRLQTLFLVVLFSGAALAQTNAAANANASASQNSSVSAGPSGAQVETSSSTNANASTELSKKHNGHSQEDSANAASSLSNGTAINAELTKPVDARKSKPGDAVVAKTMNDVKSDGKVIIPKGSRIVGHVTEAKSRAEGESQSSLGILFDHAVLKNGQELPLNASIQAIAATQSAASLAAGDEMDSMASGGMSSRAVASAPRTGGGLVGGVGSTANSAGGAITNGTTDLGRSVDGTVKSTTSTGASVTGGLNSASSGIVGLPGLSLNSATAAATQGSVITSAGKNIHLDSGTQIMLKVVDETH